VLECTLEGFEMVKNQMLGEGFPKDLEMLEKDMLYSFHRKRSWGFYL